MSGVSEGETHVAAMRLVCQSLEDHEQQGIEIQWDVLQQMLDHMDTILQGIADQRRDDAEEIEILKKERNAAYENVSTVRDQVAAEIEILRKDRDHWRAARQDAIAAGELMQAEIESLKTQLDDARVATINAQGLLDAARAETVEARRRLNEEIDRHNATHAVSVQQRDEIAYLRARLDEERSVSAGLRQKLAELDAGTTEPEGQQ